MVMFSKNITISCLKVFFQINFVFNKKLLIDKCSPITKFNSCCWYN